MALKVNTNKITWKALSLFCFAFQKKIYVNGFDWELITLSKVIKIINKISGCSLPRKVPKVFRHATYGVLPLATKAWGELA